MVTMESHLTLKKPSFFEKLGFSIDKTAMENRQTHSSQPSP